MAKLSRTFYSRRTDIVARSLIGKVLARRLANGMVLKAIITETEAYLGIADRACHTFRGRRTRRTETMWGPPGLAYVYLIYGMYSCLNAVTRRSGVPEAVLIRAARPLAETRSDWAAWQSLEPDQERWKDLMSGPGKLCRALEINRKQDGLSLLSNTLWIEEAYRVPSKTILKLPRIGIPYAKEAQKWPLRFLWNSGRLYESLFRHYKDNRSNSLDSNKKIRKRDRRRSTSET